MGIEQAILDELDALHEKDKALVKEFWYEEGVISYTAPPPKEDEAANDMKYARLVGANSWNEELAVVFANVSLLVSQTLSQAQFLSVLLVSDKYEDTPSLLKFSFAGVFVLGTTLWVLVALRATIAKMRADRLAGDYMEEANLTTRAKRFVGQLIVLMFNVPRSISEAPARFHPSKAVQAFAALRIRGGRFWVLGFPTKGQYHSENEAGLLTQLPVTVFLNIPLVVIQLLIGGFDMIACASLVFTTISVLKRLWDVYVLMGHRRAFYTSLKQGLMDRPWDDPLYVVNSKLLQEHFNVPFPEPPPGAELSESGFFAWESMIRD